MITASYKGQKIQIVPSKGGVVVARVGGVAVARDCKTAQEATAAAKKFIDELAEGGEYSVTPNLPAGAVINHSDAKPELAIKGIVDDVPAQPEFVEVASSKKNK